MQCPFCEHEPVHKHGKTAKGVQRFKCPECQQTFTQTFDTIYYRRQVSETEVYTILQSHQEGTSGSFATVDALAEKRENQDTLA